MSMTCSELAPHPAAYLHSLQQNPYRTTSGAWNRDSLSRTKRHHLGVTTGMNQRIKWQAFPLVVEMASQEE